MPALMMSDFPPVVGLSGVYWEHTIGSRACQTAPGSVHVAQVALLLPGAFVARNSSEWALDVLNALVALSRAVERSLERRIARWTRGR